MTATGRSDSLEVRLPVGQGPVGQNLSVLVGGAQVSPQRVSEADTRMMVEPFDPTWEQKQDRKVVTKWDLFPESSQRGTIAASPDGFFIADQSAFPLWQTPFGIFTRGSTIPDKEMLTIVAPRDFRVLASGKALKRASDGSEVSHPFSIDTEIDFPAYVVAGRYQETLIASRRGNVQFWTFHPIDAAAARTAAERLSSSMDALTDFFGPPSQMKTAVRIAESPVELPAEFGSPGDSGGASFPEGALLDPRDFPRNVASEATQQLAEYELTRTWFGWRVLPAPGAEILMGRGMGLFGEVVAAEGRGQDERRRMVASLIDRYDEARSAAPDRRIMEPPEGYSRAERISAGYRAGLFFVALEDLCGHDNLKAAMRDILYARWGSDAGPEELRAAAESASGKDLAEIFRMWLIHSGIPADFRARYQEPFSARR